MRDRPKEIEKTVCEIYSFSPVKCPALRIQEVIRSGVCRHKGLLLVMVHQRGAVYLSFFQPVVLIIYDINARTIV